MPLISDTNEASGRAFHERHVDFDYTVEDAMRFNQYLLDEMPGMDRARATGRLVAISRFILNAGALAGLVALFAAMQELDWPIEWRWPVLFGIVVFGALLLQGLFRGNPVRQATDRGARDALKKDPKTRYGNRRVFINRQYIVQVSAFTEFKISWPAVVRIVNTPDDIYVFDSPGSAIVVPRRGFESPEEADAFYGQAVKFHAEARK